jgi:hypothetical protein
MVNMIEGCSNRAFMHYTPHFREYENRGELWTFRCLSNGQDYDWWELQFCFRNLRCERPTS